MELEASANPYIGSGVRDVAAAIEADGLLEPSQEEAPTPEQAPEEAQANPEPTEGEELASQEAEVEGEEPEAEAKSTEAEAEPEVEQELPDTLDGLAEAVGLSADECADHVKVPVTVGGKTEMVTLAEARKGYQLEADYRQKTTELADQRRTFESNTQAATTEWQNRFQSQADLTAQLEQAVGDEAANLNRILAEEGADAFLAAQARVEERKKLLDHANREREQADAYHADQQEKKGAEYRQDQGNRLRQALPDFADAEKGPKLWSRIQSSLITAGFNEQEIAGTFDHRMWLQAHKAMLYDDLKKAKPGTAKKVKGLPRVQKPGAAPEKGDAKRQKTAAKVQRLKSSGSPRDFAATIFEEL